ncbi:MAG: SDR family oxidoreductase [Candidatus Limnocylindrales bacterium]
MTTDHRTRWALILGASSGMGEATSLALAEAGYDIVGVHLDSRSRRGHVDEITGRIRAMGREAVFLNMNAADDAQRMAAIATISGRFVEIRAATPSDRPYLRVILHSLAFGSLAPYIAEVGDPRIDRRKMEMTANVMAHSLVYWAQDLFAAGLLEDGSRIIAMTSEGSSLVVPTYGAVSAAKAALESHVRQLALEFGHRRTGITVNAIQAGVTMTPALMKVPVHDQIIEMSRRRNPSGRMTTTDDVARAVVGLAGDAFGFVNGAVIPVDGGEAITH